MEQIERVWPGWEVVRKIGSGSFGAVYEIRRDVFGREERAALKVLSIPESQEEIEELYNDGYDEESITTHYKEHLADIVREYSLMLEMKGHTNVVYCDDVKYIQHEDGIGWDVYIKMELLTPLMKVVPATYDEAQTVRLGVDLCNALVLCKQENIVHRDIKPQNIFVSKTGDYKLGDFGVAKISDKTATGTKVGTFDYMAPEVYRGESYGSGADIYSLGLVLYWMMNQKKTPFLPLTEIPSAAAKEEARNRRFHGEVLPEPACGSDALKAIVLKACAFDPKERYQSAAEMREDLKKLDTGAVFVPPVIPAAPGGSGEGTVNIFTGMKEKPATPEEGTVNIFGEKAAEEKTEYIKDEKTEYIRDEKTEYIPRSTPVKEEKPEGKKKKKSWLFPAIAGVLVIAILLLLLRSCGGTPAGPGDTTGSEPGTTQTDGTTAPEDTTAPEGTTAPTSGETTVSPTTAPEQTMPPTTVPPVTQPAAAVLTGIAVSAKPGKTAYFVGETLNAAGLTLKLSYSDGTSQTVTSGFTCNPTKLDTAGTQKITVTYNGKTATFDVSVSKVEVSKVALKSKPSDTNYFLGENLNIAGLSLTVTYNNGSTNTVSSGFTCSPTTLSAAGEQTVTVSYEGKTTTFTVTVLEILSSGSCGDNLTYVLTSDGHLEITGSGAMHNYQGFNGMPWSEYRTLVTSVSLPDGLTTIGSSAFSGHGNLTAIDIPDSVISIGQAAFHISKKLESVEIPDGVEMIGYLAFDGVAAASFVVPSKVTELSEWTFSGDNLTDVWILNPDCKLHSNASGSLAYGKTGTKVRLHGFAGSTTQAYAEYLSDRYVFVEIT